MASGFATTLICNYVIYQVPVSMLKHLETSNNSEEESLFLTPMILAASTGILGWVIELILLKLEKEIFSTALLEPRTTRALRNWRLGKITALINDIVMRNWFTTTLPLQISLIHFLMNSLRTHLTLERMREEPMSNLERWGVDGRMMSYQLVLENVIDDGLLNKEDVLTHSCILQAQALIIFFELKNRSGYFNHAYSDMLLKRIPAEWITEINSDLEIQEKRKSLSETDANILKDWLKEPWQRRFSYPPNDLKTLTKIIVQFYNAFSLKNGAYIADIQTQLNRLSERDQEILKNALAGREEAKEHFKNHEKIQFLFKKINEISFHLTRTYPDSFANAIKNIDSRFYSLKKVLISLWS
jgi:hypothetical protein